MKPFTRSRILVACVALFSMLFMQLAVAAYSCPMLLARAPVVAMTDCAGMDMEQAPLCHIHATGVTDKQSQDKSELPPIQAFVPAALVQTLLMADLTDTTYTAPHVSDLLLRSTAPPIAIRHCCFRI